MITIFVAVFCTGISVYIRNHSYIAIKQGVPKNYTGTGKIEEYQGNRRYIFHDPKDRPYIYYSDAMYTPGQSIFTTASVEMGSGGYELFQHTSIAALGAKMARFTDPERGFDKEKWLLMNGFAGIMYEKRSIPIIEPEASLSMLKKLRMILADKINNAFSNQTAGLSLGMLIGDRSGLTKEEYKSFVDSGLVHIIAVSGGNIVLILSFFNIILFFLPYYLRLSILVLSILIYATICGRDSSIMRATWMALLGIGALFGGRIISVWRSMGFVYVGMLLWNPYYLLYDLGFIFSFSALAGLVFFAERRSMDTAKRINISDIPKCFWNVYLLPSFSASIGITVPLLFFIGQTNILSIFANILVIPLVPLVMIYGFFSALLYSVTSRQRIVVPQELAVKRIYFVNERVNVHTITLATTSRRVKIILVVLVIIVVSTLYIHSHQNSQNNK